MMKIRKTRIDELDVVMDIYGKAAEFMRRTGNASQWVNGYPSRELIRKDIEKEVSYVCTGEKGEILGTFCFMPSPEPNYHTIYEGSWLNEEPYGVIHRLAGSGKGKGVADCCFDWCFAQYGNVRVDTHRDNKVMQHILRKHGYTYCGIIHVRNGTERLAFQKVASAGAGDMRVDADFSIHREK
ncbi:MAG: GNAT family N-acetyltransferase [Bacteroides sp.]|nr:GNAT family N-acetyltransferase [Bacteroides sp.]